MPFVKKIVHKELSSNQETISGFEGPNAYGKWNDKVFNIANTNDMRHLIRSNKPISCIMWETNLRDHGPKIRIKTSKT